MRVVRRVDHPSTTSTVDDLMAKSVVSGHPRQSLFDAAVVMRTNHVSALAVLDGEVIVGIITERDMLRAVTDGREPQATPVSEYMTRSPLTIEADRLAAEAAEMMVKHRVRHLPVTDKGRLIGFLSARDLLVLKPWPRILPIVESW
jgi:CBS domain-containing protein